MLQRTWRRAGSYILTERLVVDWWQPFHREDVHHKAKVRLHDALKAIEAAAGSASPAEARDSLEGPSLFEINALAATFTATHNVEDLSATLQYVHEQLGQELTPFHYHALLRTFSYLYDRDSALQLLTVMAQREEMTLETYARAMDMLHCLAPEDVEARLLTTVALAQSGFGTLLQVMDAAGSETATARAFGPTGEAFDAAVADPTTMPGEVRAAEASSASSLSSSVRQESPVLRALLHHVTQSGAYSPVAALLVVVWMRALGATLSDWDVALPLTALLAKPEDFPRVRAVTGHFSAAPRGCVNPQQFLDRLAERGELTPASAPLCALAEAMRTSLTQAGVNMRTPVWVGLVNAQTTGLTALVERALTLTGDRPREAGEAEEEEEGFVGCDAAQLYHYLTLLHGTMKAYTSAVQVIGSALTRESLAKNRAAANARTMNHAENADEVDAAQTNEIPFTVDCHFLMDAGALLPSTSATHRAALAGAYRDAVRAVAQHARELALHASTEAVLPGSASSLALHVGTLGAPLPRPSLTDATNCEGYGLLFLRTAEEARQALAHTIAAIEPGTARLTRTTRFAFRQLVHFCVQHPRVNSKMTATGLAERRRWARYLEARDTALNLFGSAQQARDVMQQLFYDEAAMPALRSAEVVTRDVADMTKILFPDLVHHAARTMTTATATTTATTTSSFSSSVPETGETTSLSLVDSTALLVQSTIVHPRATLPHVRCDAHVVPPCLYEPGVYNPYPQSMLNMPADFTALGSAEVDSAEADFFAELWQTVVNPSTCGHGDIHWYVQDTDMYLLLLRCLVHRLDWEAAVHLTTTMMAHNTYTHRMDQEVTRMFQEAGDPSGFLAFKVATKLFDGRILRDGQGTRGHSDPMEVA